MAQNAIPDGIRSGLDGYAVGHGFGNVCPSCGREYASGDRLVVIAERSSAAAEWDVMSVVCSGCEPDALDDDDGHRTDAERALVSIELGAASMTLELDGETARLLDYVSPPER
jgi:hypothetical protein